MELIAANKSVNSEFLIYIVLKSYLWGENSTAPIICSPSGAETGFITVPPRH